ncbi:MAG TPA: signal peptide peptidase SppA [Patescibacteria group bacterium]|nr:signal peptide peptidase SppA [Patescibacteria group bacterium]
MKIDRIVVALALVTVLVLPAVIYARTAAAADSLRPLTPPLRSGFFTYRFVADVDDAAALFVNPAGLGAAKLPSYLVSGTYGYDRLTELTSSLSLPGLGFGYSRFDTEDYKANSYFLGLAGEIVHHLKIGTTLRWHNTDFPGPDRSPFAVDLGFLLRPHRYLSLGGVWKNTNRPRFLGGRLEDSFTGGVSIRPLTERATLSAQGNFADGVKPGWMAGGRLSIVPGIEFFGAYMRDLSLGGDDPYEEWTGGIAVALGSWNFRPSTRSRVEGNADYSRNSFAIERRGAFVRDALLHRKRHAEVTVSGAFLDEGSGFTLMGSEAGDLHRILRDLESVRADKDVTGLLLKIGSLKGAFIGPVDGNLYEIREAVRRVRESGKPVVAYLKNDATASELYLASAADRVVAPFEATIGMLGVSLEINRMKRLFAKLGVDWDFYTAGRYKSTFHTPYTDTTTAAQEEELYSLVNESYRLLIETIADGRGIDRSRMRELADGRIFSPDDAVAEGLVDVIGWEETGKEELGKLLGADDPEKLETAPFTRRRYWDERWTPPPAVAIVGAYGSIKPGTSKRGFLTGDRTMGSETVVDQLKAASAYPGVKAILFRIDSGGGSALASDEILNELRRIQKERKIPVIISMGNVAGSGGYWISMYGDAIFADPFTITGSIGVVAAKPVIQRLYERIGVTNEVYKAGKYADAWSARRNMTDEEMELLGAHIERMYDYFIENVAAGRGIDPDRVREIAEGRIYFGTQALGLDLVDRLGGLKDAVEYAASQAGIADDYRTVYFRAFPPFWHGLDDRSPIGIVRALRVFLDRGENCFDETQYVF